MANQPDVHSASPLEGVAAESGVQSVPQFFQYCLVALFVVGSVASFTRMDSISPIPMTTLLDVWIVLFVLWCFFRGRNRCVVACLGLGVYLASRFALALLGGSPMLDTIQAYKWPVYLLAFAFAVGRHWVNVGMLRKLTSFVLAASLLKYVAVLFLEGSDSRPELLVENNFELALLCGLVAVLFPGFRRRWLVLIVLGVIVILSGSRSASVIYLIVLAYTLFLVRREHRIALLALFYLVPIAAVIPIWIFVQRFAVSSTIDRLKFLDVFVSEVDGWHVLNWLFGTYPITPLSDDACNALYFYQSLFSTAGDGTCYAVIFHSFVLRVIFDAGIVGLLLAHLCAWWLLRRGGVSASLSVTLVSIAFANGLSVSGLNNPYVALPMLIALVTSFSPNVSVDPEAFGSRKG